MKRTCCLLPLILFLSAGSVHAQKMMIKSMEFGTGIEDRRVTGIDTAFVDNVKQIYCFTQISGAADSTSVTHVWYYKDEEKARIQLDVASGDWRTWSSKTITPAWKGPWRVMVLGENGEVLSDKMFKVIASNK